MLSIVMLVEVLNPIINDMTEVAIDSILDSTVGEYELICYVHGDNDLELSREFNNTKIVRDNEQRSCAVGYNLAVKESSGDILCIVHNDVIMSNYGWNYVMEIVAKDGDIPFPMVDESQGDCEKRGVPKTLPWQTSSCCYMVQRKIWDDMNGLDEDYLVCHGEDIDFFKRCEQDGRELVRCDCTVIHHRGVSRSFVQNQANSQFFENWRKYNEKHDVMPGEDSLPRLSEIPDTAPGNPPIAKAAGKKSQMEKVIAFGNKVNELTEAAKNGLNIGAGNTVIPNLLSVDLYNPAADRKWDVYDLQTENVDLVVAHQVLEHLDDTQRALQEWYRVLLPGGHIVIDVPDMETISKGILENPPEVVRGIMISIYGRPEEGMRHVTGFTEEVLIMELEDCGFEVIDSQKGYQIRPTPSVGVIARKPQGDNND